MLRVVREASKTSYFSGTSAAEGRLDSWKEIAVYLKRSVRAVRLWEQNEGLPVHRQIHNVRGSVYAYRSEIDFWRSSRQLRVATRPARAKLAVLPFQNLSGDPDQEYFSDGLTEEMITQLSRLDPEQLAVIARTSAMLYRNTTKSMVAIAEELGVNYILEGGVRRDSSRVRISARLVQVRDQTQLWAESYEHDLKDVFAIQDKVAQQISLALELEFLHHLRTSSSQSTHNPAAYEAYLKGRYYWNKRAEGGLKKGAAYFEEAIRIDPSYALAYSGLADSFALLRFYSIVDPFQAGARLKAAAVKAVELDGNLGEARISLAKCKAFLDWDLQGAEVEFLRGITLSPGYLTGYQWYGDYLVTIGRPHDALTQFRRALEIDPISPVLNVWMGMIFFYNGEYDHTIEHCKKALEIDPRYALGHWGLGLAYEQQEKYREAALEIEQLSTQFAETTMMRAELGRVYSLSGREEEARRILGTILDESSPGCVPSYHVAGVLATLGETGQAFEWLGRAKEQHSPWLLKLRTDPRMKSLRNETRFQQLISEMGCFPSTTKA